MAELCTSFIFNAIGKESRNVIDDIETEIAGLNQGKAGWNSTVNEPPYNVIGYDYGDNGTLICISCTSENFAILKTIVKDSVKQFPGMRYHYSVEVSGSYNNEQLSL